MWMFLEIKKSKLIKYFILSLIRGVFAFYPLLLIQRLVDMTLNNEPFSDILMCGLFYIFSHIVNSVLQGIMKYNEQRLQAEVSCNLKEKIFDKIIKMDFSIFINKAHTDFLEIVKEDSKYLSENGIRIVTTIINDFIIFIIGIYFVVQINILLVLVIVPLGVISSLVSKKTMKKITSLQNENKTSNIELFKAFSEGLNAIFVIRNLRCENKYKLLLTSTNNKLKRNEIKQAKYNAFRDSVMSALFMTTIGIVMIFLSFLTYNSYISVGGLTAMLMYNHMLVDPLLEIFEEQGNLVKLNISQKRIKTLLLLQESNKEKFYSKVDSLIINHLNFNYGEKEIFRDLNLTLKSGESLIITGETGCGKSTLANIIAGFVSPKSGCIQFECNGKETNNSPKINYMIQNGYLFDASLFDNLKIANELLTENEFIEIINICKLDKVYEQHLLDSIGENGSKLSAGERKRVQIARNIVDQTADIYIFDELTANLDSEIADIVFNNVRQVLKDKICIFIEHDKSKVDLCTYHLSL